MPPKKRKSTLDEEDVDNLTFEPGSFCFTKIRGYPFWPSVVYNNVKEIPTSQRRKDVVNTLKPLPHQVVVLFLDDYRFSVGKACQMGRRALVYSLSYSPPRPQACSCYSMYMDHGPLIDLTLALVQVADKVNVKAVNEVDVGALVKSVKLPLRTSLKKAIESMEGMMRDGEDGSGDGTEIDDEEIEDEEEEPPKTKKVKRLPVKKKGRQQRPGPQQDESSSKKRKTQASQRDQPPSTSEGSKKGRKDPSETAQPGKKSKMVGKENVRKTRGSNATASSSQSASSGGRKKDDKVDEKPSRGGRGKVRGAAGGGEEDTSSGKEEDQGSGKGGDQGIRSVKASDGGGGGKRGRKKPHGKPSMVQRLERMVEVLDKWSGHSHEKGEVKEEATVASSSTNHTIHKIGRWRFDDENEDEVPALNLKDVSLETLIDEEILNIGAKLFLMPYKEEGASAVKEAAASAPQYATLEDGPVICFDGRKYDSVEDLLEELQGRKLNKREKKGWHWVRYYDKGEMEEGEAQPPDVSRLPTLADYVLEELEALREADFQDRRKMKEAIRCLRHVVRLGKPKKLKTEVQATDQGEDVALKPKARERQAKLRAGKGKGAEGVEVFQENPFLNVWKTLEPGQYETAAADYLIWNKAKSSAFVKHDDTETYVELDEEPPLERRLRKGSKRRSLKTEACINEILQGKLSPHTLLICERYWSKGAQGISSHHINLSQPYTVKIHPDVMFLCDLHAHLANSEIIGFLAGKFDMEENRKDDGATDVEMDPGSEIEIREVIAKNNMQVVGWYHSHPTFHPDPSLIDIENQYSYQTLLRDDETGIEPFLGLIVSTYDEASRQPQSIFRFFHVRKHKLSTGRKGEAVKFPMLMEVQVANDQAVKRGSVPRASMAGAISSSSSSNSSETRQMPPEPEIVGSVPSPASAGEAMASAAVNQPAEPHHPSPPPPPPQPPVPADSHSHAPWMSGMGEGADALPPPPNQMEVTARVSVATEALSDETPAEPWLTNGMAESPRELEEPVSVQVTAGQKQEEEEEESAEPLAVMRTATVPPLPATASAMDDGPGGGDRHPTAAASDLPAPRSSQTPGVFLSWKAVEESETVPSPESIWATVEESYLPHGRDNLGLRCTLQTVQSLVQYYSRLKTRVNFSEEWKPGIEKGAKFETSLWQRVVALDLGSDPNTHRDFLTRILQYIFASWKAA